MLATLLRPDAGTAKIFGHDVVKESQIVRQLIGVTGQYASVDESLSATENLIIFSRLLGLSRKEAKSKAVELLEEFGLSEAARITSYNVCYTKLLRFIFLRVWAVCSVRSSE